MNIYTTTLTDGAYNFSLTDIAHILCGTDKAIAHRFEPFFDAAFAVGRGLSDWEYADYCMTLSLFLAEMDQSDIDNFMMTFTY